jgi:hypothetical protein
MLILFLLVKKMTLPNSIPIVLQLPTTQFEEFAKSPEIREQIVAYLKKHHKTLPKALQDILEHTATK